MPMTRSTMAAALSTGTNRHPPRITSLSLARNHALFPLALATATTAAAAALLYRIDALGSVGRRIRAVPPAVYDRLVLHMTEVWYRAVLERLEDGSAVLDVGIGTAGASESETSPLRCGRRSSRLGGSGRRCARRANFPLRAELGKGDIKCG
mmetsp:Transcript_20366/g.58904  ORF Transcript_20366/g.58904 Transcript_20366/m.58904 type:complete len:152 (-) Transcript_20366:174-629(-)